MGKISFRQREYNEVMEAHLLTGLRSPAEAQFWQQDPYPNNAPPRRISPSPGSKR